MAFGYTGLAKWGNFSTREWLSKALHDSAPPDFAIDETLERLKANATETFNYDPSLKNAPRAHKKMCVMFSGYIYLEGKAIQGCAILSNYHDVENNGSLPEAADEFEIYSAKNDTPTPAFVRRVGSSDAMVEEDINVLRKMLLKAKPAQAIVGKAFEIVRDIADRPKSGGAIGKQLTSIVVPRDPKMKVRSSYSTEILKRETYMPTIEYLLPDQHMTVSNISIKPVEDTTPPLSVPKVNKNAPCPCGSNKKYRHCHGRITR